MVVNEVVNMTGMTLALVTMVAATMKTASTIVETTTIVMAVGAVSRVWFSIQVGFVLNGLLGLNHLVI